MISIKLKINWKKSVFFFFNKLGYFPATTNIFPYNTFAYAQQYR